MICRKVEPSASHLRIRVLATRVHQAHVQVGSGRRLFFGWMNE